MRGFDAEEVVCNRCARNISSATEGGAEAVGKCSELFRGVLCDSDDLSIRFDVSFHQDIPLLCLYGGSESFLRI